MATAHHEKTVRYRLTLDLCTDALHDWLVGEAEVRRLHGWIRPSVGAVDLLLAGEEGSVDAMVALLVEGLCPHGVKKVEARPLRGDEPVWSGFHRLPSF